MHSLHSFEMLKFLGDMITKLILNFKSDLQIESKVFHIQNISQKTGKILIRN